MTDDQRTLTIKKDDSVKSASLKYFSNGFGYTAAEEETTLYTHNLTASNLSFNTVYGGAFLSTKENSYSINTKDKEGQKGVTAIGDVTINLDAVKSSYVYGGGAGVGSVLQGNVAINVKNSSKISSSVYGGGNRADSEGNVAITLTDSKVGGWVSGDGWGYNSGSVFGGGYKGDVDGGVTISLANSTVGGSVYGGGNNGDVTGNVAITLTDSTVCGSVYGGGSNGDVTGDVAITLENSKLGSWGYAGGWFYIGGKVYGGGNKGDVGGSVAITLKGNAKNVGTIYAGGYQCKVAGDAVVAFADDAALTTYKSTVYGSGSGSKAAVEGESTLLMENVSGEFNGTIKKFDNLVIQGNSSLTFKKGQDKSMRDASYQFVLNNDTAAAEFDSAMLTWDKSIQLNDVTVKLDMTGTNTLAEKLTLISSSKFTKDTSFSTDNVKIINEEGNAVYSGLYNVSYTSYDKTTKTGGTVTLNYDADALTIDEATVLSEKFTTTSLDETLTVSASFTGEADLSKGNDILKLQVGAIINVDSKIDLGDGNDTVYFTKGAVVNGDIYLGNGENEKNIVNIAGDITPGARIHGKGSVVLAEGEEAVIAYNQFTDITDVSFTVKSNSSMVIDFRAFEVDRDTVQKIQANFVVEGGMILEKTRAGNEYALDAEAGEEISLSEVNSKVYSAFGENVSEFVFAQKNGVRTVMGCDDGDVLTLKNGAKIDGGKTTSSSIALKDGNDTLNFGNAADGTTTPVSIRGSVDLGDGTDAVNVYTDTTVTGPISNAEEIVFADGKKLTVSAISNAVSLSGNGSITGNIDGNVQHAGSIGYKGTVSGSVTGSSGNEDTLIVNGDSVVTGGITGIEKIQFAEKSTLTSNVTAAELAVDGTGTIAGNVTANQITGTGDDILTLQDGTIGVVSGTDSTSMKNFKNIILKNVSGSLGNVAGTGTFQASDKKNAISAIGNIYGFDKVNFYAAASDESAELSVGAVTANTVTITVDDKGLVSISSITVTAKEKALTLTSVAELTVLGEVTGSDNADALTFNGGGSLVLGKLKLGKEEGDNGDTISVAKDKTLILSQDGSTGSYANIEEIVNAFKEAGVDKITGKGTIEITGNFTDGEELKKALREAEIACDDDITFKKIETSKYTKLYQINAKDRSSLNGTQGNDWMEFNQGLGKSYIDGKLTTYTGDDIISFDNKAGETTAVTYELSLIKNGKLAVDLGDGYNVISTYSYDTSGVEITDTSIKKVAAATPVDGMDILVYRATGEANTVKLTGYTYASSNELENGEHGMKVMNVDDYIGNFNVITGESRTATLIEKANSYDEYKEEDLKDGDIVFPSEEPVSYTNKVVYADNGGVFTLTSGTVINLAGYTAVGFGKGTVANAEKAYEKVVDGTVTAKTISALDGYTGTVTDGNRTITADAASAELSYDTVTSISAGKVGRDDRFTTALGVTFKNAGVAVNAIKSVEYNADSSVIAIDYDMENPAYDTAAFENASATVNATFTKGQITKTQDVSKLTGATGNYSYGEGGALTLDAGAFEALNGNSFKQVTMGDSVVTGKLVGASNSTSDSVVLDGNNAGAEDKVTFSKADVEFKAIFNGKDTPELLCTLSDAATGTYSKFDATAGGVVELTAGTIEMAKYTKGGVEGSYFFKEAKFGENAAVGYLKAAAITKASCTNDKVAATFSGLSADFLGSKGTAYDFTASGESTNSLIFADQADTLTLSGNGTKVGAIDLGDKATEDADVLAIEAELTEAASGEKAAITGEITEVEKFDFNVTGVDGDDVLLQSDRAFVEVDTVFDLAGVGFSSNFDAGETATLISNVGAAFELNEDSLGDLSTWNWDSGTKTFKNTSASTTVDITLQKDGNALKFVAAAKA